MNLKIKRLAACYIDLLTCSFASIPFYIILTMIGYNYQNNLIKISAFFVPFILLIFKDLVFENRSLGKKIVKLEIITKELKKPNSKILILKNITLLLWPIEIIVMFLSRKGKRIGDYLFKTSVVEPI